MLKETLRLLKTIEEKIQPRSSVVITLHNSGLLISIITRIRRNDAAFEDERLKINRLFSEEEISLFSESQVVEYFCDETNSYIREKIAERNAISI